MEVVLASSSVDGGIGCWNLQTGAEQLRYKSCSSPSHGLVSVGGRFIASSQIRDPSSSSSSVLKLYFWSWSKPQVEVKSFPAEPIKPLAANHPGTYLAGGGSSGDVYFWQVETGRLLKKWHAHYRAVTCLVFSEDDSLLISGSEDGSVRVWSLIKIFDDLGSLEAKNLYLHSFTEHTLCVTDVVIGYGGCNAIILSASEDRTCKVWSLATGTLLRNIVFPSIIDAIVLDPAEHIFYAGSRDGKIFIAALNTERIPTNNYGMHIIGSFSNHSKAVTCLAYGAAGNLLISGSEDGMVRVWNARTRNIIRTFKHAKGPVNNILVVKQEIDPSNHMSSTVQASSRKKGAYLSPPLEKYTNSTDEDSYIKVSLRGGATDVKYLSSEMISKYAKELQHQGSAAASEMEVEKLKHDCQRSMQMANHWKKMYEDLQQFCVKELLDGGQARTLDENGK
ncbi:protein ROOT INITIATION DEFECTIVE 3-like [Lotus japonicus]|uniref:protein ROOT INITIATION DEFECTIVE 3-like n=1 Tax=Lotus japonicus TaxID=34305 RepID=UPI00258552DC|nr:protein ROOT INITIATION DEFECTIVE 3-like [Lotus japonicus]XP_057427399.1 protein ROOT INITIATION DEFECTIVE 3-like [Lotus japonicus]XP_057427400.1 protein ROOT INITIATION DEFECTIVE 3-like [Lotus japonicus]